MLCESELDETIMLQVTRCPTEDVEEDASYQATAGQGNELFHGGVPPKLEGTRNITKVLIGIFLQEICMILGRPCRKNEDTCARAETFELLCYRNWQWIEQTAARNRGNQLHGRRFHVWRWEQILYKTFPTSSWSWMDEAQDENTGKTRLEALT